MPFSARIGHSCTMSGKVEIAEDVYIGHNVQLQGNIFIGRESYVDYNVQMVGNVEIAENSVIGSYTFLSTMPSGRLIVGKDVYVNSFSVIGASERVEIRNHCIFAAYVQITDAEHGFEDPDVLIKHAPIYSSPVVIGENVWLGSGAMIMKGVEIGSGCVIGAKSLVTKSIPAGCIAYGSPASVVRKRGSRKGNQ